MVKFRIFRKVSIYLCQIMLILSLVPAGGVAAEEEPAANAAPTAEPTVTKAAEGQGLEAVTGGEGVVYEADAGSDSIFLRAWQGGFVVFMVLFVLVVCSVLSWAILVAKFLHLRRLLRSNDDFVKAFWESRSLNDLNSRLGDHPYSPVKEVFRTGYAELVRGSHLKEQVSATQLAVNAALENLGRSLTKAKNSERKRMEKYLPTLATIASASPFIGLFGTVWGIMGAFEGIARTGSASLAAVAPGISEALIATAFGLAAAIPAVIGYNMSNARIRGMASFIDGFAADFLNIVERYLVTDRSKSQPNPSASSPL